MPRGRPQTITWAALKAQFGTGYAELRQFRAKFIEVMKTVRSQYPAANVEAAAIGLILRNSPPPVSKRQFRVGQGVVIDVKPVEEPGG